MRDSNAEYIENFTMLMNRIIRALCNFPTDIERDGKVFGDSTAHVLYIHTYLSFFFTPNRGIPGARHPRHSTTNAFEFLGWPLAVGLPRFSTFPNDWYERAPRTRRTGFEARKREARPWSFTEVFRVIFNAGTGSIAREPASLLEDELRDGG